MFRRLWFRYRLVSYLILTVFIVSMVVVACGGNDDMASDGAAPVEPHSGGARGVSVDSDTYASTSAEAAIEEADSDGTGPSSNVAAQMALDRLVIRTSQITLAVEDTPGATVSVRNLAITKGGFVFASSTYIENDRQYAQITLRVPSDRFDETISDLRSAPYVTEVVREESSSQDVSAEYVDNESRLTALEETQRRYLALLAEADTIDEILRLETELTKIRTQIETITGRQNYLDEMTSFSTITVNLRPSDVEEEVPDDEFSIARIFESAWDRSTGALAGVAEAVVVVAIFAAFFTPIALALYMLFRFARRVTARLVE